MPSESAPAAHERDVKSVTLELVDSPVRKKIGRPTTLTVRLFLTIVHKIEEGWSIPAACEACHVTYAHFRFRVSKSPRLQERVTKAESVRMNLRHEEALASVMAAGDKSWMAHAWFLERVWPNLYALRQVARPDSAGDQKPVGTEIPAERLAEYGKLMIEFAKEESRKLAQQSIGGQAALPDGATQAAGLSCRVRQTDGGVCPEENKAKAGKTLPN